MLTETEDLAMEVFSEVTMGVQSANEKKLACVQKSFSIRDEYMQK